MKHSKISLTKNSLTIQILTKNNAETIKKTLKSITRFGQPIIVADMGSKDNTIEICKEFGIEPIITLNRDRSSLRNDLTQRSCTEWNFFIEPWEVLVQGNLQIEKHANFYVSIIHENILTQEVRFYRKGQIFHNPVFEKLDCASTVDSDLVLYSHGRQDYLSILKEIEIWKNNKPMLATPYYYESLVFMSLGKYDEFLSSVEHFMHMIGNEENMASVMSHYYYAMVYLMHKKKIKPILQNINLCIRQKPLMAEFWCLIGDAYYYLQNNFALAINFYENAIELGKYRLKTDKWPMDISKYKDYPEKMIESCKKILNHQDIFKTQDR